MSDAFASAAIKSPSRAPTSSRAQLRRSCLEDLKQMYCHKKNIALNLTLMTMCNQHVLSMYYPCIIHHSCVLLLHLRDFTFEKHGIGNMEEENYPAIALSDCPIQLH